MFLENITILRELNIVSICVRILLALLLGGLLGIEREQKQRPAGFRTYIIVCLGATLASITNLYMCEYLGAGDPARLPAQVISGIGFLGAGTILVTRNNHIKGLTTAAGLWCCATIGIAAGTGFYSGAIICGLIIVFSLRILSIVDKMFDKYRKYINLYVEFSDSHFTIALLEYCRKKNYEILDLDLFPSKHASADTVAGTATFTIKLPNPSYKIELLKELHDLEYIVTLQEFRQ